MKSNGLVNLTERRRTSDRKALVASLDPATMITFDVAPDSVEFDRISVNSEQMLVQAGFHGQDRLRLVRRLGLLGP